jgi:hypothetical protein
VAAQHLGCARGAADPGGTRRACADHEAAIRGPHHGAGAGAAFAGALLRGERADAAYAAATDVERAFDVTAGFALLLEAGAFTTATP